MDCEAARLEIKLGKNHCLWSAVLVAMLLTGTLYAQLHANTWTLLRQDPAGARRGSALRYAPKAGVFVLWGFMNDVGSAAEQPLMRIPEYDVVLSTQPEQWQSQFCRVGGSLETSCLWPMCLAPTGHHHRSERTVCVGHGRPGRRSPPDLTLFSARVYHPPRNLIYFTGGAATTFATALDRSEGGPVSATCAGRILLTPTA
jgi:hypothetical protein